MNEDLANLLCPDFYKFIAGSPNPIPGQIVWAHTVYPPEEPWIVKVLNYDALNPSNSRFEVKRLDSGDRSHMPIAELNLSSDENLYVYVGKERPLIVVKDIGSHWRNILRAENLFLCVPVFSFKPRHEDAFRLKTMAFCHPNLFHMPDKAGGCTEESAARFELAQPISKKALRNFLAGLPPRPVALSDEAFALFVNHLGRFLNCKDLDTAVCSQIDAYRDLVLEELRKQGIT
jgi:hypothetical protein